MYLNYDVFDVIYNEANENDIDIIRFNAISIYDKIENFFKGRIHIINPSPIKFKENTVIKQPELSNFIIIRKNESSSQCIIMDFFMWLKCIKTTVYRRAIFALNKKRYSEYILGGEDNIMSYIIFQFSKTFKHISKYGILRIKKPFSANEITDHELRYKALIYLLESVFRFSISNKNENQIVFCIFLRTINIAERYKIRNRFLNDKLKKLAQKISKYGKISKKEKEYINQKLKVFF